MKFLNRLSLLDLALIAGLLAIGIVWVVTRSNAGSIDDVDLEAWRATQTQIVDAFVANDLAAAKAGLERAAVLAEAAKDDAADGIRAFADLLTGTDINAVDAALLAMSPVPRSVLFQGLYATVANRLLSPDFPTEPPTTDAEWVYVATAGTADGRIEQYWGAARWSVADAGPTTVTAEVEVAEIGLVGMLTLIDGEDGLQLSLSLGDLFAEAEIGTIAGFWTADDDSEAILDGAITSTETRIIVMTLSPEARDANLERLRTASEISISIRYDDEHALILRVQVGETGRAAIAEAFPSAPTE